MTINYQSIRKLIAKAELKQAIEGLLLLAEKSEDEDFINDLVLLHSSYNRLKKTRMQNLISDDNYNLESNKLTYRINSFLEELKENFPSLEAQATAPTNDAAFSTDDHQPNGVTLALQCIQQANYTGYFNALEPLVSVNLQNMFSTLRQRFIMGDTNFQFAQQLEAFAKEVERSTQG